MVEHQPRRLVLYETTDDRCPWQEWFDGLQDPKTMAAIDARLLRLRRGHFGDARPLGDDIWELRLHIGPGYRVYLGVESNQLVVLLCGGRKGSQKRDIRRAKKYWRAYRS